MKKFLLTASMLVMGVVATFAQSVPDASTWKAGDELEGIIKNPSFTTPKAEGIVWEYTDAPDPRVDESLFESYSSGTKTQVFQYVLLPKGKYRVTCQGYYRGGGADQDAANFADYDTKWQDNAWLFVQNGEYKDETFKGGHIFKTPLMPRLFEHVQEQIYFKASDEADWADDHWYAAANAWGPGGSNGSRAWFEAGKYSPYEQGDVMYNIVDFFLAKDGYVKLGAMKTGEQSGGDTFFVTNVKLYYQGAVGDDDELMILQSDCDDLMSALEEIRDDENNAGLLSKKLEEALMLLEMEYGNDPYDYNLKTATAAKLALDELNDSVSIALSDLASLKNTLVSMETLAAQTNFKGKSDLETALASAKDYVDEDFDVDDFTKVSWETFAEVVKNLNAARFAYLTSDPKKDGAWDFSSFIANRFFTNEENNPTWNAETNLWEYSEEVKELYPELLTEREYDGSNERHVEVRNGLSGDVVLSGSDDTVPFKWYKKGSGGPGWDVYFDHTLTSCKAWAVTPTSGVSLIGQYLTGLPNGFYSLTGMATMWQNEDQAAQDASDNHFVITSSTGSSRSPRAIPGNWYMGANQALWNTLSTDMVEVTDGELHVEASVNGFYSITGFQLFYYGETPDFYSMILTSLNATKEAAEELTWKGDQAAVKAILDQIPTTISDKAGYDAATELIAEANAYITKAKAATTDWKTPGNFLSLATASEDEDVTEFVLFAMEEALDLAESDKAVYTDAIDYDNRYKAYNSYVLYRESLGKFLEDEAVKDVLSEQNAYLKQQIATVEKLDEFKTALATPYNQAKFKDLGAETATLDKPIDVSFVLINPKFHEGPSKGWSEEGEGSLGTWTNDNLGIEFVKDEEGNPTLYKTISEIYGTGDPYTFSQTLNGLPAGTYEVRTHATFRDTWRPDGFSSYLDNEEKGDFSKYNLATLFAEGANGKNRQEEFVKSIYSTKLTEPSFTYYSEYGWLMYDSDSKIYDITKVEYLADIEDEASLEAKGISEEAYNGNGKEKDSNGIYPIPFDCNNTVTVYDEEEFEEMSKTYYFPQRTIGVVKAIEKDINNYYNKVVVYLPEAGSLKIGIDKAKSDGNASLMMYDWELFYCGKEAPVAINEVVDATEGKGAVEYYSINGVKLNAPQAGLNIVKYQDGTVKKIFIK